MATSAGTTDALIGALIAWIDRLFPDPPRGERLKHSLAERFGEDSRAVTAEVCEEIEAACHEHSRNLDLQFVADGSLRPDAESPGWPPSDPAEAHARAACVREVTRRANGGGDPGTVVLVLGRLLGQEPKHLSDVIYRDRTRQWWTAGRPAELALPAETPVAALISGRTFSSGEALAYHLQSQGRGSIVGQASRGAADHVTPICLSSHVRAFMPEGYVRDAVTGGNWEGAGVQPDVVTAEADALEAAVELLLSGDP